MAGGIEAVAAEGPRRARCPRPSSETADATTAVPTEGRGQRRRLSPTATRPFTRSTRRRLTVVGRCRSAMAPNGRAGPAAGTTKGAARHTWAMKSTMQDAPLLISDILRHGQQVHGDSTVITVEAGGHRAATFAEVATRAEKLAAALTRLGVQRGDRVGTFCWNNQGHLEAYLAIPSMGAVLHTLNIRLPADQLAYVINHAEDRFIIVDASLIPLLAADQGRAEDRRDHHRRRRGRHLAARRDPLLRAAARRRGARLRMARARRALRRGHVLHERHHRQPQGRRVLAPLDLAAHDGRAGGLLGRA